MDIFRIQNEKLTFVESVEGAIITAVIAFFGGLCAGHVGITIGGIFGSWYAAHRIQRRKNKAISQNDKSIEQESGRDGLKCSNRKIPSQNQRARRKHNENVSLVNGVVIEDCQEALEVRHKTKTKLNTTEQHAIFDSAPKKKSLPISDYVETLNKVKSNGIQSSRSGKRCANSSRPTKESPRTSNVCAPPNMSLKNQGRLIQCN